MKAIAELVNGHGVGLEIDIKEGAAIRGGFGEEATLICKLLVKWGAGEGSKVSYLNVCDAGFLGEGEDIVEATRILAIESEDETAVYGNAVGLDFVDCFRVSRGAFCFPIGEVFDSFKMGACWGFESDE